MKKLYSYIILLISALAILVACTKEINVDFLSFFDFEISEENPIPILISTPHKLDLTIITKEAFEEGDYKLKYSIREGEGLLKLNESPLAEDALRNLIGLENSLIYTANSIGTHRVNIVVIDSKGETKLKPIIFEVDQSSFEFSLPDKTINTTVGETIDLKMSIVSPEPSTFKTKYNITVDGDAKPIVLGNILVNGEKVTADTFLKTKAGDFSWQFEASAIGTTEYLFTTENASGIVKTSKVKIIISEIPNFEFSVSPIETSEPVTIGKSIDITFKITEKTGTTASYVMNFNDSLSGVMTYNGEEYPTGPIVPYEIPIKPGESKATFTSNTKGTHKITFTVTNDDKPIPMVKTAEVTYIFQESATDRPLESIEIQGPDEIAVSEKVTYTLKTTPENITAKVIWSVSDTSIATINEETGELTPIKEGNVTITATAEEKAADGSDIVSKKEVKISGSGEWFFSVEADKTNIPMSGTVDFSYNFINGSSFKTDFVLKLNTNNTISSTEYNGNSDIAKSEYVFTSNLKEGSGVIKYVGQKEGEHKVSITLLDQQQNKSETKDFIINVGAPTIPLDFSVSGPNPQIVQKGETYISSDIVSNNISFFQGTTITGKDAVDTSKPGEYTIIYSSNAPEFIGPVVITRTVVVNDPPIAVISSIPNEIEINSKFSINASGSTDSDDSIATATWDFGDGSPETNGSPIEHIYTEIGTYTIKLTVLDTRGGIGEATKKITVINSNTKPTSITIEGSDKIEQGDNTKKYSATVLPSGVNNKNVTWSSSNTAAATINTTTGVINALAVGTTIITATSVADNSITATKELEITPILVKEIEVSLLQKIFKLGEGFLDTSIMITVKPENAANKMVSSSGFPSNFEPIAGSQAGTFYRSFELGKADIIYTAQDGSNVTGRLTLEVVPQSNQVANIKIVVSKETISIGEKINIDAEIFPTNDVYNIVDWTSNKQGIIEISSYIRSSNRTSITGLSEGTTELIATARDGSGVVEKKIITVIAEPKPLFDKEKGILQVKAGDKIELSANVSGDPTQSTKPELNLRGRSNSSSGNIIGNIGVSLNTSPQTSSFTVPNGTTEIYFSGAYSGPSGGGSVRIELNGDEIYIVNLGIGTGLGIYPRN